MVFAPQVYLFRGWFRGWFRSWLGKVEEQQTSPDMCRAQAAVIAITRNRLEPRPREEEVSVMLCSSKLTDTRRENSFPNGRLASFYVTPTVHNLRKATFLIFHENELT